jgi:hypothetical protein
VQTRHAGELEAETDAGLWSDPDAEASDSVGLDEGGHPIPNSVQLVFVGEGRVGDVQRAD